MWHENDFLEVPLFIIILGLFIATMSLSARPSDPSVAALAPPPPFTPPCPVWHINHVACLLGKRKT